MFQAGPGRGAQARDGAARLGRALGQRALEGSLGAAALEARRDLTPYRVVVPRGEMLGEGHLIEVVRHHCGCPLSCLSEVRI